MSSLRAQTHNISLAIQNLLEQHPFCIRKPGGGRFAINEVDASDINNIILHVGDQKFCVSISSED